MLLRPSALNPLVDHRFQMLADWCAIVPDMEKDFETENMRIRDAMQA
jgi:hypothetical protein